MGGARIGLGGDRRLRAWRDRFGGDRATELQTIQTQLAGNGESILNARMKYNTERMSSKREIRKLGGRVEHLESLIGHKRRQLEMTRQMAPSYEKLYGGGCEPSKLSSGKYFFSMIVFAADFRLDR